MGSTTVDTFIEATEQLGIDLIDVDIFLHLGLFKDNLGIDENLKSIQKWITKMQGLGVYKTR